MRDAKRIDKGLREQSMLAEESRARADDAAWAYTGGGGPRSTMSRKSIAQTHGITVEQLRAAEKRLRGPIGMTPDSVDPADWRTSFLKGADFYVIGKHVLERSVNDASLTWKEIEGLALVAANVNLNSRQRRTLSSFSKSGWHKTRNRFIEYWERFGIRLKAKRKAGVVEAARRLAVSDLEPFFGKLQAMFDADPILLEEPGRIMNLDETPLCRQPNSISDAGLVSDPEVVARPKTASKGKPPAPITAVTVTYGSGEKGPLAIIRKGDNPTCDHYWTNELPPGFDKEWAEKGLVFGTNPRSDRMTTSLFIDFLANHVIPDHRRHIKDGKLCFVMDAPTCHGVSQTYEVNPKLQKLADDNDVVLVWLPHNTSHVLQPNDQGVHGKFKLTFRAVEDAVNQVWQSKHAYIDRRLLLMGIVKVERCQAGLVSLPNSGLRDPNMKHRPWRAAFFRDSASSSPCLNARDIIVTAAWAWMVAVTKSDILESYKACHLVPWNPNGWKEISQQAARRAKQEETKILPAEGARLTHSLRVANRNYKAIPIPEPTDPAAYTGTARSRQRAADKVDQTLATQFLKDIMQEAKRMHPVASIQYVSAMASQFTGRRNLADAKADLVTGKGTVLYAEESDATYHPSQKRLGKTGSLLNLTKGRKHSTGRLFSAADVRKNRAAKRLADSAGVVRPRRRKKTPLQRRKNARLQQSDWEQRKESSPSSWMQLSRALTSWLRPFTSCPRTSVPSMPRQTRAIVLSEEQPLKRICDPSNGRRPQV